MKKQRDGLKKVSVAKHATTLRISRGKKFDVDDIIKALFYRSDLEIQEKAKQVLMWIVDEQPYYHQWKDKCKELDINQSTFYHIHNKLRGAGILRKADGRYLIDNDFSNRLHDLKEIFDHKIRARFEVKYEENKKW